MQTVVAIQTVLYEALLCVSEIIDADPPSYS